MKTKTKSLIEIMSLVFCIILTIVSHFLSIINTLTKKVETSIDFFGVDINVIGLLVDITLYMGLFCGFVCLILLLKEKIN